MSDYIDHLPSQEREKIRKKLRSPEAYERLRESVKGPEDLEREMEKRERMAEVHLAIESDPQMKESLKSMIEKDISEKGIDNVMEMDDLSPDAQEQIKEGNFSVTVESHPQTHEDAMMIVPEGNVQEKIPVQQSLGETYASQLLSQ
jgi:hypothetical protein